MALEPLGGYRAAGRPIDEADRAAGRPLDEVEDTAFLIDPFDTDCPIIGAARGFCRLSGWSLDAVLGRNCCFMSEGVPQVALSKSSQKNVASFCSTCCKHGLAQISEITSMQPNARRDGSHFVNFITLGLCVIHGRAFIVGVMRPLGEGLIAMLSQAEFSHVIEESRGVLQRIRQALGGASAGAGAARGCVSEVRVPDLEFAFFMDRLQDHCVLMNNGYTAVRREHHELASGCLVFGDRPVRRRREGLAFSVRVDEVMSPFAGLPLLGFTRRRPMDGPDLYPDVARCMGASALVGAFGEAFARDQHEHLKMGFQPPPRGERQSWALQPDVPAHRRAAPVRLERGDVLRCVYSHEGRLRLERNGETILDFDIERPLDDEADYYAVVDVCFSVWSLSHVPTPEASPEDMSGEVPEATSEARPTATAEEELASTKHASATAGTITTQLSCSSSSSGEDLESEVISNQDSSARGI